MGRKVNINDVDMLALTGRTSQSRLKHNSDRRAVIDIIVGLGGRALMGEINQKISFDARNIVNALVSDGWLEVIEAGDDMPPMPTRWPSERAGAPA